MRTLYISLICRSTYGTISSKAQLPKNRWYNMTKKGLVFDIDRFATHDGPGIRAAIFLKGCPLTCKWCHSPESQKNAPEVIFQANRCAQCKKCTQNTELCPTQALRTCGTWHTADEIAQIVTNDKLFYKNSGGGVTITGGEPLMQWEFAHEILSICHSEGIHTALETSGYGSTSALLKIAKVCNLIYFDIKFPITKTGDELHTKYTGVSNSLIWSNFTELCKASASKIIVRIPCIPGINNDPRQISEITQCVEPYNIQNIELMPYNPSASAKYEWLGRGYELDI